MQKMWGIDSSHYRRLEKIPCPDCEAEIDYEIGPDESMEDILDILRSYFRKSRVKKKSKRWMLY